MIDINKEYTTRDGNEVRIYAIDGKLNYPIHGAIKREDGWKSMEWTKEGTYYSAGFNFGLDLIEKKQTKTIHIGIYLYNGELCFVQPDSREAFDSYYLDRFRKKVDFITKTYEI